MSLLSRTVDLLGKSGSATDAAPARETTAPHPLTLRLRSLTANVACLESLHAQGMKADWLARLAAISLADVAATECVAPGAAMPLALLRARLERLAPGVPAPTQASAPPTTAQRRREDPPAGPVAASARPPTMMAAASEDVGVFGDVLDDPLPLPDAAPDGWARGLFRFTGCD